MRPIYPKFLEAQVQKMIQEDFLAKKIGTGHNSKTMVDKRPDSQEAVAERLKQLRWLMAGDNQTRFAVMLDIEVKRWNNFERGLPLPRDVAMLIVQKWPDISLDWLYRGLEHHLTVKRQQELADAGKRLRQGVREKT